MPSIRTTSPSSKPSRPSSRARQNGNAIPTPRALSPSPPGSSPASAAGPATTASPDPRSCDEASKTSERSSTELLWRFTMCESDSPAGGEGARGGSLHPLPLRERKGPVAQQREGEGAGAAHATGGEGEALILQHHKGASVWRVAVVAPDAASADDAAAALGALCATVSAFKAPPGEAWHVEGFATEKPQAALIEAMLALACGTAPPAIAIERVAERDWLAE